MNEENRVVPEAWGAQRRAMAWGNIVLQSALLFAILVVVTLIAMKIPGNRIDLTSKRTYAMSAEAEDLLRNLDYNVRIWLNLELYGTQSDKSLNVALTRTDMLLEEFSQRSDRVTYSRLVPTDQDSLRLITEHWGMVSPGTIYVLAEPEGRTNKKAIDMYQVFEGDPATGEVHRYRGEGILVQTIKELGGKVKRIFYEVEGHSEAVTGQRDMAVLREFLVKNEGVEIRRFKSAGALNVPPDCDVLMILGPGQPYEDAELDVFRQYLKRGGRMLIALQARRKTGLEKLLPEFGVRVGDNVVHEPRQFMGTSQRNLAVTDFNVHAVNRGMVNFNFPIPHCCSLEPVGIGPRWKITPLARSSPASWTETGPINPRARPQPGGENESHGPHALIMAVEKQLEHGSEEDNEKQTRLIVWGSPVPFGNQVLGGDIRRIQYVVNQFRWLGEKQTMDIKDQNISERPLNMTEESISRLRWGVMLGFPLFAILLGLVTWFIRRK